MGPMLGRGGREHGSLPMCLFWTIWWEQHQRAFDYVETFGASAQIIFMYYFLEFVEHCIGKVPMSMIDFIDWLGLK